MVFDVFSLSSETSIQKYVNLLSAVGNSLPYYIPDYLDIFCTGFADLIIFSFTNKDKSKVIFMPGYYRPVTIFKKRTPYFDFITPYGYTGPCFSDNITPDDIQNFWIHVDKWHKENNVISEFVRFDLFDNHIFYSGDLFPTLLNIKGKIIGENDQWTSFEHKVRKNVNKARREKVSAQIYYKNIDEIRVNEFCNIYTETMIRTNAAKEFFISSSDFQRFFRNNQTLSLICTVYSNGQAISSELVLVSDKTIYSFLGGTSVEHFDKRPNDLLKFELISWCRTNGKKYFILGGGLGEDDGIFKYKKSFFPNDVVQFYTGRKIIDKEKYKSLLDECNLFRRDLGFQELDINDTSFFPLYRKQN